MVINGNFMKIIQRREVLVTNIKNTWHTLVPEIDEENTFFSVTGDKQEIYNQNYGGWSIWN